jgi:hypothetical protein
MHIGSHASRRQVKRMAEMQQALVGSFAHKKKQGFFYRTRGVPINLPGLLPT